MKSEESPMTAPEGIRILVIDDHPVLRAGLVALIGNQPDMQVVGEAETEEETIEKYAALQPDITLMDIRLPTISGIELTARLRARWPAAKVIAFTSHWKEEDVYQALENGMWAYVRKGAPAADL